MVSLFFKTSSIIIHFCIRLNQPRKQPFRCEYGFFKNIILNGSTASYANDIIDHFEEQTLLIKEQKEIIGCQVWVVRRVTHHFDVLTGHGMIRCLQLVFVISPNIFWQTKRLFLVSLKRHNNIFHLFNLFSISYA